MKQYTQVLQLYCTIEFSSLGAICFNKSWFVDKHRTSFLIRN